MLSTTPAARLAAVLVSAPHARRRCATDARVRSAWNAAAVALVAAAILLPGLGGPAVWDEDEPLNAGCSLAMWQTGDWVVPTFNGRLRVEKPPLVNWLQLVGFGAAGTGETGARVPSAVVTIGTCLLTWRLGTLLFGRTVGIWAGVVMATAVWTSVAGRAATPDAALGFCTTAALVLVATGHRRAARVGNARIPATAAAGVGAACGLAVLAKGPVGLVLPLAALLLHAGWDAIAGPAREDGGGRPGWPTAREACATVRTACVGVRPGLIVLAALAVAAPWYVAVSIRTAGEWPRGFFLVHNAGRFTGTMEGHSGSAAVYYPIVLLVGMFPWSCGWIPVVGRVVAGIRGPDAGGMRLLVAWAAVWIGGFSLSATKLPGYIWPVYPAIAVMTGFFLARWTGHASDAAGADDGRDDRWMRLGWVSLMATGVAIAVGLARMVPDRPAVAVIGLVPIAGGVVCWWLQSRGWRLEACRTWAATGAVTVFALATVAAGSLGGPGSRELVAGLAAASPRRPLAAVSPPPSVAFYARRLLGGPLPVVDDSAAAAAFFAAHPEGRLIVDADRLADIAAAVPTGCRVLAEATTPLRPRRLVVLGDPSAAVAAVSDSRLTVPVSPEGT